MSRRTFFVLGLVVSLVLAGVLSFYASAHPDGLEFVAERTGFLHTAEDSATAGSPFADYGTSGLGERLGTGVAGVLGVLVTLLLAGGLALAVRRRRTTDA